MDPIEIVLINNATSNKKKLELLQALPPKYAKEVTMYHLWYAIFSGSVTVVRGFMEWCRHRVDLSALHWNESVKRCHDTSVLRYLFSLDQCSSTQVMTLAIRLNKDYFVKCLLEHKIWAKQEDLVTALYEETSMNILLLLIKDLRKRFDPLVLNKEVKKAVQWRFKENPELRLALKALFPTCFVKKGWSSFFDL